MNRYLAPVLALSLVLAAAAATAATPEIYDLGVGPGQQKYLGVGNEEELAIWIDAGANGLTNGVVCKNGNGDQLCAIDVTITLIDGVGFIGTFVPAPTVVYALDPDARGLRLNVLQSLSPPAPIAQALGVLTLNLSTGSQVDPTRVLASGQVVDAGGNLQTIPEVPIAIPEPGHTVLLWSGIVGLALLSRLRGVA